MGLHWSHDIESTICNLYTQLTPNGTLAFSMPLLGTFWELHHHGQSTPPFLSEAAVLQYLQAPGFQVQHTSQENWIEYFQNRTGAIKSLKKTGVTSFPVRHFKETFQEGMLKMSDLSRRNFKKQV